MDVVNLPGLRDRFESEREAPDPTIKERVERAAGDVEGSFINCRSTMLISLETKV